MAKTPEQIYFQHEETLKAIEKYQKLPQRCEQLEQLVRYMYRCYVLGHDWGVWGAPEQQWVERRMEQLGLLDGEQNEIATKDVSLRNDCNEKAVD